MFLVTHVHHLTTTASAPSSCTGTGAGAEKVMLSLADFLGRLSPYTLNPAERARACQHSSDALPDVVAQVLGMKERVV